MVADKIAAPPVVQAAAAPPVVQAAATKVASDGGRRRESVNKVPTTGGNDAKFRR
jgi:hypothetical protein